MSCLNDGILDLRRELVATTEFARINPDRKSALFKLRAQFLDELVVSGGVGDEDLSAHAYRMRCERPGRVYV